MFWSSPRQPLQCFDSSQYVFTLDRFDNRCIAPTKQGSRCRWDISPEELEEANDLLLKTRDNIFGNQSYAHLQRLILLRCCGEWHRQKLEQHSACLSELVRLYQDHIATSPVSRWTSDRRVPSASSTPQRMSSPMYDYYGNIRQRYQLRSGPAGPLVPGVQSSLFVPYSSAPIETVRAIMTASIPSTYAKTGEVYALDWPSQPGFIKLGYSGGFVDARVRRWQICHPGARAIHTIHVPFPERVEKLIHLELESKRRRIVICPICMETHFEWFEIMPQDMIRVMNAWKEVVDADELYNYSGSLSYLWQQRLDRLEGEISSQSLVDILKVDAKVILPHAQPVEITNIETRLAALMADMDKLRAMATGIEVEKVARAITVNEVEVEVDVAAYPEEESLARTPSFDIKAGVEDGNTADIYALQSPDLPDRKPCPPTDKGSVTESYKDWDLMLEMFNDFMTLISVVC